MTIVILFFLHYAKSDIIDTKTLIVMRGNLDIWGDEFADAWSPGQKV
jgi:hypothetical protein